MKNNAHGGRKLTALFSRYGALCAAVVCAALVGGTWFFTQGGTPSPELSPLPTLAAAPTAEVRPSDAPVLSGELLLPSASPLPKASPMPDAPESAETWQLLPGQMPRLTRPVSGAVAAPYAMDALQYNATLAHWETHSGVDLAGERGEAVLCALDGQVTSVTQDTLMGTMVIVSHDNDWTTVYAALDSASVSTGQSVKAGDTLGTLGNSAGRECSLGPHLHFEVMHKGVYQDPTSALK